MIAGNISAPVAFFAGLLSFFSPCILPLVPSYMSYITGSVFSGIENDSVPANIKKLTVLYSLCFIGGFSAIFILLGAAASFAGNLFLEYRELIRLLGGLLIIFFGLHIIGLFKIGILNSYFKFGGNLAAPGYFRAFIAGIIFAAGWTPCVGPILGSILIIAGTDATLLNGIMLLGLFSLGMAIPFFIISLSVNYFLAGLKKINRWVPIINGVSGVVLVIVGILLATGQFESLTSLLY